MKTLRRRDVEKEKEDTRKLKIPEKHEWDRERHEWDQKLYIKHRQNDGKKY